jgi:hypothetical protein
MGGTQSFFGLLYGEQLRVGSGVLPFAAVVAFPRQDSALRRDDDASYRDFLMGERIPGHGKRFLHIEFSGFHIRSPFEEKMPDNAGISVFC